MSRNGSRSLGAEGARDGRPTVDDPDSMILAQLWWRVRDDLRGQMTRATFEHLLNQASLIAEESSETLLTVAVSDAALAWLSRPAWQGRVRGILAAYRGWPGEIRWIPRPQPPRCGG
jgi:hypothetical protein